MFNPKIIGFLCNWCGYAAADLAGNLRLNYPSNLRIIKVMCSGRIDPSHILEAFKKGADGVLIVGCHPGDCHYINGNYRAKMRIALLKKLLQEIGLEPERLRIDWASAGEGERFANIVREFFEEIRNLGPNPVKEECDE
ncbi:MAG: hydrogenase iron-sulfur subunit [archaeon GB-1867-097]|nr:hydrogenase iron-sulfur subunit [Candidatus Culexmicrobium thermophilum]MCS7384190.1 hydrogenase iron-sulfur subunit [Candidatus Culexmicrobium thermophilum]RLE56947.1 MAG: methyl-viologen-reducing hydrogenase subunit delta [Candidatus Verstraetearchaeota archaeon]HDO20525.1 hydrogenase iron-sulfur subunit [Candidatus Bathyarchaeota archaeon]